jgi:ABC-type transport system involved in multi-copper enzyme maturation permease subunit
MFHFLLILIIFLSISTISSSTTNATSIYEVLENHGLPMGIFPKGVNEFNIDEDGKFWVHLDQACNAKFENELHYDRNVSGSLVYGKIDSLTGLKAQDLFLWFPVMSIRVDVPTTGLIYFDVGAAFKQFSLSLFETPPECVAVGSDDSEVCFSFSVFCVLFMFGLRFMFMLLWKNWKKG